jgi:hypothetical protein
MLPHGEDTEIGEKGINLSGPSLFFPSANRTSQAYPKLGGQQVMLLNACHLLISDIPLHLRLAFLWLELLIQSPTSSYSMIL